MLIDKYEDNIFTVYDENNVATQAISYSDIIDICMEYEDEIRKLKNKLHEYEDKIIKLENNNE